VFFRGKNFVKNEEFYEIAMQGRKEDFGVAKLGHYEVIVCPGAIPSCCLGVLALNPECIVPA
jgi:hypothetical protein